MGRSLRRASDWFSKRESPILITNVGLSRAELGTRVYLFISYDHAHIFAYGVSFQLLVFDINGEFKLCAIWRKGKTVCVLLVDKKRNLLVLVRLDYVLFCPRNVIHRIVFFYLFLWLEMCDCSVRN